MLRYCAYHPKYFGKKLYMGKKAPLLNDAITHGCCDECLEILQGKKYTRKTNAEWMEEHGESKEELNG